MLNPYSQVQLAINWNEQKITVAFVFRMRSADKHGEMSGKQGNIWANKSCRQEFPQIFEVRLNHHECQSIQELDEKKKKKKRKEKKERKKDQGFHISFMIKPLKQFFCFHRITPIIIRSSPCLFVNENHHFCLMIFLAATFKWIA